MHLFHHRHSGHQKHEHEGTRSDNDRKGERK
jgi:hypothetical protein